MKFHDKTSVLLDENMHRGYNVCKNGHTVQSGDFMRTDYSKNTEKIVSTAVALFKERGYLNVSICEICAAAKIPRSSFYTVFSTKKDIIDYILSSVKRNEKTALQSLIRAENDWERMWSLANGYLSIVLDWGPTLGASLLSLELEGVVDIYSTTTEINEWMITLGTNCQKAGIIRNRTDIHELVPVASDLIYQVCYNWCRQKGQFPLVETARKYAETLYDIDEAYRW